MAFLENAVTCGFGSTATVIPRPSSETQSAPHGMTLKASTDRALATLRAFGRLLATDARS